MLTLPMGFSTLVNAKDGVQSNVRVSTKAMLKPPPILPDLGPASNLSPVLRLGPGVNVFLGRARSQKTTALLGLAETYGFRPIIYHEVFGAPEDRYIGSIEELMTGIDDRIAELRRAENPEVAIIGVDSLSTLLFFSPAGENSAAGAAGRSNTLLIALRQWDAVFAHLGVTFIALLAPPSGADNVFTEIEGVLAGAVASVTTFVEDQDKLMTSRRPIEGYPLGDRRAIRLPLEAFLKPGSEVGREPSDLTLTPTPSMSSPHALLARRLPKQ